MDKLFQKRLFNGHREFELVKQRYLKMTIQSLHGRVKHYRLDLLALNPVGQRRIRLAKHWLMASVAAGVLALLMALIQSLLQDRSWQQGMQAMALLLTVVTFVLLFFFFYRSKFEWVYMTRHSGIALVRFFNHRPDKSQFKQYIEQLELLIQQLQQTHKLPFEKQLAGEMKMLRRLAQEKILTTTQYEQAKGKLFLVANERSGKE